MKVKGIIALLLALVTVMVCPAQISAAEDAVHRTKDSALASVGYDIGIVEEYVEDIDAFKEYIVSEVMAFNEDIFIGDYNLPMEEDLYTAIAYYLCKGITDVFHVGSVGFTIIDDKLTQMNVQYLYTKEEADKMYAQCEAVAKELTEDIIAAEHLTEAEKALLLHDRLALVCNYDKKLEHNNKFDIYGALVEGYAVCEGYTNAYIYLLEKVGIRSEVCSSDELKHSWNIVYIDDVPYHVDVTWDDVIGLAGEVYHDNFLLSTEALYNGDSELFENGHTASDYNTSPQDTTYDNYFWRRSYSPFQLLHGELYYIDSTRCTINKYSAEGNEELYRMRTRWNKYWNLYGRLSTDGEDLFYNTNRSVVHFDEEMLIATDVFTPEEVDSAGMEIYGFEYKDGRFICDLSATNNYFNNDAVVIRVDKLYEKENVGDIILVPSSIKLISPFEVIYCPVGSSINPEHMQLEVNYNNGSQKLVTSEDFTLGEFDSSSSGTKSVSITWEGFTTSFDVHVYVQGDANGDGKISVADATTIQKYVASIIELNDIQKAAGEVTGDNRLTVGDATKIQKYIAGIVQELV